MKKRFFFTPVLIALLACCFSLSAELVEVEDKVELNQEIARVNGAVIKKKDFKWAYTSEYVRLTALVGYLKEDEVTQLKQKTFDRLINRELLYQESRKLGIEVNAFDIETAYQRIKGQMMAPVDKEGINQRLDLTESDIKDEFRRAFAAQMVVEKNVPIDRTVSEEEVKTFFEQNRGMFDQPGRVKLSHIVIEFPKNSNPAQRALARSTIEEVKKKLDQGESFEELAKKYSTSFSRVNGGAIGYLPRGKADKHLEDVAYAMKTGETSGIVESSYGYHILKVTGREPDYIANLDEAKTKKTVVQLLMEEKESSAIRTYLQTLKAKSEIEVFVKPLEIQ